jgi:general secretion pathway protein B
MSYILDALKKADAERTRSPASGLTESNSAIAPQRLTRKAAAWRWGLPTALLLVAGAVALTKYASSTDTPNVASKKPAEATVAPPTAPQAQPINRLPTTAITSQTPVQKATAEVVSAATNIPATTAIAPPSPLPPQTLAPAQTIDVMAAAPSSVPTLATPQPELATPEAPTQTPPSEVLTSEPNNSPAMGTAPPGAPPPQILKRVPLPPGPSTNSARPPPPKVAVAGRPALPAATAQPPAATSISHAGHPEIVITGTSYSTNAAHRMLIVNGKVIKEGQEMSPGLTLESIGQRTAVFNQGGSRFNVNY